MTLSDRVDSTQKKTHPPFKKKIIFHTLLRYKPYTTQFTHLKHTNQRLLVYSQLCKPSLLYDPRTFPSSLKETPSPLAATPQPQPLALLLGSVSLGAPARTFPAEVTHTGHSLLCLAAFI